MKARVLTRINIMIAALMGILGFNSCHETEVVYVEKYGIPADTMIRLMYGVPSPERISRTIEEEQNDTPTDEQQQPE